MTRWQRNLLDVVYVAMESIPWFVAIAVFATIGERGYLSELARELRLTAAEEFVREPERAVAVAASLLEQAEVATAGPALWAVAVAGFGGFWVMRAVIQLRLSGPMGAVALVLASVFGLNVLLHVILANDLLVWQSEGLATFIDDPNSFVARGADFDAVVDRGGATIGSGAAIAATSAGIVGVWLRFLHSARRPVGFNHVLRSFGIGFAIILASLVIARFNGIGQLAIYAIPFFMLGLLALAVANGERAALPAEGHERVASWGVSVTATLTLLVAIASIFGLLAALDVVSVLGYLGGFVGTIVEWLLIIILTPIFWILATLLEFFIPDGLEARLNEFELPSNLVEPEVLDDGETEDDFLFPRWPFDALKVLIFVALVWVSYRVGRALLRGRDEELDDEFDEFRADTGGGTGLGGLLRGLMRRRSSEGSGWFRLRPIYGVYGRSVIAAEDRGFERRRSETPLEYSSASGSVLVAPVFSEIAEAFDAARYGGHDADPEQLRRWVADLETWERANPPSEELRDQLEQIRPPRVPRAVDDPATEFAERVKRGREAFKQMREGQIVRRGDGTTER